MGGLCTFREDTNDTEGEAMASRDDRFEGRTVVVTGAGSGIGAEIARMFGAAGGHVVGADVATAGLERTVAAIRGAGGSADAVVADVSRPESGDAIADAAGDRVDVLVNNAGVASAGVVHEMSLEEWDRCLGINLNGTFYVSRAVVPRMLESGGSIVNLASVLATLAEPERTAYCASKGGVRALSVAMARDLAPKVRVNSVSPGVIRTPAVDTILADASDPAQLEEEMSAANRMLRRMAEPREVGGVVLFLGSEESSFITGQDIVVDGGMSTTMR
jgi:NAD(P)-dependent dehydrogenase (short-subunit alcohol dehydrogenase family)